MTCIMGRSQSICWVSAYKNILVCAQVPEGRRLADPPLMRLESEGGHAYLSMLLQLSSSQTDEQQQADIEARLVSLAHATLQRFQVRQAVSHPAPYPEIKSNQYASCHIFSDSN